MPTLITPDPSRWEIRHRTLDVGSRGLIMGILNTTPDSFSDGGKWTDPEAALEHAFQMVDDGADIIDVGGESTRPGAAPVDASTEIARTVPVIAALTVRSDVPVSIDTSKAAVAEEALRAGASVVNDVTGLCGDPRMAEVIASAGAGVVLMHMQGEPRTMQVSPSYGDVLAEVIGFLRRQIDVAEAAGIPRSRVVVDPGIGFGKTLGHNLTLLRHLPEIREGTGRPVLLGASRKSFLGKILGTSPGDEGGRDWATVALTSFARERGVAAVRVHDVLRNAQAMRMTEAILGAGAPADRLL